MPVRLVACDLDGTLFGPDRTPEPRTVAAVNALVERGVTVIAATGRSHFDGIDFATKTGARLDWFIGANGGHRVHVADRTIEERLVFDENAVDQWIPHLEAELGDLAFGFEHDDGLTWSERFFEYYPRLMSGLPRVDSSDATGFGRVGKFFIAHPERDALAMLDAVRGLLPQEINVTTSGIGSVEATPAGADKALAVARLCAKLGFDRSEVIAFGDDLNDMTMLEWAGRGIAMGNARDQVKAVADEVTASNTDFGVAQVLESL